MSVKKITNMRYVWWSSYHPMMINTSSWSRKEPTYANLQLVIHISLYFSIYPYTFRSEFRTVVRCLVCHMPHRRKFEPRFCPVDKIWHMSGMFRSYLAGSQILTPSPWHVVIWSGFLLWSSWTALVHLLLNLFADNFQIFQPCLSNAWQIPLQADATRQ